MRVKKTTEQAKRDYAFFQENYLHLLEKIKSILKVEKFSFSLDEIDKVGEIYRKNFNNPEKINLTYDDLLYSFIAYCGEAWMHYFGGEWFYIKDKTNISYGYPQIIKWGPKDYPWSGIPPISWANRIENNVKTDSINLPFDRKLHYFSVSDEWNKKMKQ